MCTTHPSVFFYLFEFYIGIFHLNFTVFEFQVFFLFEFKKLGCYVNLDLHEKLLILVGNISNNFRST
jgi:hypothetical protein